MNRLRSTLHLLLPCILVAPLSAQIGILPDTGGTGADGPFQPTASVTLDTSTQAVYNFTLLNIPAGVTVSVVGPRPIVIKVIGPVQIDGAIRCDGQAGSVGGNNTPGGDGGAGGPGGGAGGKAGCHPSDPFNGDGDPGMGLSGGQGGVDGGSVGGTFTEPVGGGGGGGNGTAGGPGGDSRCCGPHAFSGAGGPAIITNRGGSGGGGGGADVDSATTASSNDGGGGGGGGGGYLTIMSNSSIILGTTGVITADGGAGGDNGLTSGNGSGGGGGSGGTIDFIAPNIQLDGTVSAIGGAGGAALQANAGDSPGGPGGDGAINVYGVLSGGGTVTPALTPWDFGLVLQEVDPAGLFSVSVSVASDNWFTGFSMLSIAPVPLPPLGSIEIDVTNFFFPMTFGQTNVLPVFANLAWTGNSTFQIDGSVLGPYSPVDLTLYCQSFAFDSGLNRLTGISNRGDVHFKF